MSKRDVNNPKVSIIIPVYNGENYLKDAVDSALNQTYDNLEIIVVNDGSTDNTEEICKSYGDKIRYFAKKNGGVASALNLAIKKMDGEYFSWLSHDDTYEPNKVEAEINFLKENNYLRKKYIVFSDYYLINKKGRRTNEIYLNYDKSKNKPEYIIAKGYINGLSLLIPKKAFDDYGSFDTKLTCVQDYDMWWRMAKTYTFVYLHDYLVNTRIHSKQTTNTSPAMISEGDAFYIKLINDIPKYRKIEMEGSEYCFYNELADYYKNTVYSGVYNVCKERMENILKNTKSTELKKCKVSIIIPFHNRINELMRAVDSCLNQTHQNFEIILIDDGSTEDLKQVLNMVKKNDRIVLLKNSRNFGASSARNKGIKAATGDYLAFLDSDDEFVDNKLEVCLKYALATKTKILHTSYRRVGKKEEVVHSGKDRGHCERKMIYSCEIATPTVMIERKWLEERGVLFDTTMRVGEDVCLWLELMKNNTYLGSIDEPLTVVHTSESSAAFSLEKSLLGIKHILAFLLEDSYYSKFNEELAILMGGFNRILNEINLQREEERLKRTLNNNSKLYKFAYFLKKEGIKSSTKRLMTKINQIRNIN